MSCGLRSESKENLPKIQIAQLIEKKEALRRRARNDKKSIPASLKGLENKYSKRSIKNHSEEVWQGCPSTDYSIKIKSIIDPQEGSLLCAPNDHPSYCF